MSRRGATQAHQQKQAAAPSATSILQGYSTPSERREQWEGEVPPIVQEVLRSPGQPLDSGTRAFMESRFGHDFSQVRVNSPSITEVAETGPTIDPMSSPYELEADRVANMVVGRSNYTNLQEVDDTRKAPVQSRATTTSMAALTGIPETVKAVISSGRGRPLEKSTRDFMESRFGGQDFSHVRIHTSPEAAKSADAINAKAYTTGHDIIFGNGEYNLETREGKGLLAHELVHVIQQAGIYGSSCISRKEIADKSGSYKKPPWSRSDLHIWLKEELEESKNQPLAFKKVMVAETKGRYRLGMQLLRLWEGGFRDPPIGSVPYFVFRNLEDYSKRELLRRAYTMRRGKIFGGITSPWGSAAGSGGGARAAEREMEEQEAGDPYAEYMGKDNPKDKEHADQMEKAVIQEEGEPPEAPAEKAEIGEDVEGVEAKKPGKKPKRPRRREVKGREVSDVTRFIMNLADRHQIKKTIEIYIDSAVKFLRAHKEQWGWFRDVKISYFANIVYKGFLRDLLSCYPIETGYLGYCGISDIFRWLQGGGISGTLSTEITAEDFRTLPKDAFKDLIDLEEILYRFAKHVQERVKLRYGIHKLIGEGERSVLLEERLREAGEHPEIVQPKLKVNSPDSKYEKEPERIAEQVMRMPEPYLQRQTNKVEVEERLQSKPVGQDQANGNIGVQPEGTAIVSDVLRSPSQPLVPDARAFMEKSFGHDFSKVRVHMDARAAESAEAVNALAYTVGRHIVFGTRQYNVNTIYGKRLLAHELAHVAQQNSRMSGKYDSSVQLPPEVLHERPMAVPGLKIYRMPDKPRERAMEKRQNIVVIVGRPSRTIESRESLKEKEDMETWRAAARALSPYVFEGLKVDKAFAGLKKLKGPIGTLYIIGHADAAGVGEVDPRGRSVSITVEDLTKRMKAATSTLQGGAPESVEILACFGGSSPKTMARIGEALGAPKVRAPVQTTVISGTIIKIQSGSKTTRLTRDTLRKLNNTTLIGYIKQTDALKYYDFVPGVPHPQPAPSEEEKLNALVDVLRKTGMIPYVSYNEEPGERDAVPYWKAKVEERKPTEEEIPLIESLGMKGVIEVTVPDKEEKP